MVLERNGSLHGPHTKSRRRLGVVVEVARTLGDHGHLIEGLLLVQQFGLFVVVGVSLRGRVEVVVVDARFRDGEAFHVELKALAQVRVYLRLDRGEEVALLI